MLPLQSLQSLCIEAVEWNYRNAIFALPAKTVLPKSGWLTGSAYVAGKNMLQSRLRSK